MAISGSARVDGLSSTVAADAVPTAETRGLGTRSPLFSGNVMVGYGVAHIADIAELFDATIQVCLDLIEHRT